MDIAPILAALKINDKKTLITVAAAAVLLVVDVIFVAIPQISDFAFKSAEIKTMSAEMRSVQDDAGKMDAYTRTLNDYDKNFGSRKVRLLTQEQEIPALLESISAIARGSGVKIIGIKPLRMQNRLKTAKGDIFKDVPIQINAKAGYHELGEFVSRIESAEKFMKIADLEIKSNRASPRRQDVELLLSVYLFSGNGRRVDQ